MEAARHALLKHEASVKSVGILYLLGGIFLVFGALTAVSTGREKVVSIGALLGALGVLELWLWSGLRKLRRNVRVPAMILAGIGLLGFPLGTIISAYILYVLGSKKGDRVFSDEYAQVIAATPHIKCNLSLVTKVVLAILIVLLVLFVFVTSLDSLGCLDR